MSKDGWIKCDLPYGPIYGDEWVKNGKVSDSFVERGLAKPGTLVKIKQLKAKVKNKRFYGKEEIYLIGHINPNRGVCDDCTMFDQEVIVEAYKVLEIS